jgi:hypothetical protein
VTDVGCPRLTSGGLTPAPGPTRFQARRGLWRRLDLYPKLGHNTQNFVADQEVVVLSSPFLGVCPAIVRASSKIISLGMEQARDLDRNLSASSRRSGNHGRLCNIRCHRETDTAQRLNPLSDGIYQLVLLLVVFIEQVDRKCARPPASGASCKGHGG